MDEYVLKCLFDIQECVISIESYLGEKRNFIDPKDKNEYHEMSNGLTYGKDLAGKWFVV